MKETLYFNAHVAGPARWACPNNPLQSELLRHAGSRHKARTVIVGVVGSFWRLMLGTTMVLLLKQPCFKCSIGFTMLRHHDGWIRECLYMLQFSFWNLPNPECMGVDVVEGVACHHLPPSSPLRQTRTIIEWCSIMGLNLHYIIFMVNMCLIADSDCSSIRNLYTVDSNGSIHPRRPRP